MMEGEIRIISTDFLQGKNVVRCQGTGPNDPKCLENHPPAGKEKLPFNWCGGGVPSLGICLAIFADPDEYPELFKIV
jgi:hypothetical protein